MKKLLAVILFVILVVGFTGVASAAEWQLIGSEDKRDMFFDTQSFEADKASKTYTVWLKSQFTEDYCEKLTDTNKYEKMFLYTLTQIKIDYKNKKMQYVSSFACDIDGGILDSFDMVSEWYSIDSGSIEERVFKKTYDYYKKHYQ